MINCHEFLNNFLKTWNFWIKKNLIDATYSIHVLAMKHRKKLMGFSHSNSFSLHHSHKSLNDFFWNSFCMKIAEFQWKSSLYHKIMCPPNTTFSFPNVLFLNKIFFAVLGEKMFSNRFYVATVYVQS